MQRKRTFWYVKKSLDVKRDSCGYSPKHSFESVPLTDHLQAVMRLMDKN